MKKGRAARSDRRSAVRCRTGRAAPESVTHLSEQLLLWEAVSSQLSAV